MYFQQCQKTLSVFVLMATLLPLNQRAEAWTQSGEEMIRWNDALDQEGARHTLEEIEQERRNGYAYYGTWAKDLLEEGYPLWKSKQTSSVDVISRSNRYRVIISADFPPLDVIPGGAGYGPAEKRSDPDDVQSMVRFLLYTNELDVEGLIASSATFANVANKKNILDILDLYDRVDENLRRRAPQYPTAEYLRSVTWQGSSGNWGKPANEVLGKDKDSEASEAIIRVVDQNDSRPVWVLVWGGPQEVAQAIWKVQQTRSPSELERFISKLRIYMIGLGNKTGQDGSGQWMLDNFPNLFVIVSQKTYGGMFAQKSPIGNLEWLNANIREGHGPLGAVYPKSGFNPDSPGIQEGDTPSFMYLVSAARGLNDPEHPDQESWGGQYEQRDPKKNHWYDGPGAESVRKWLPAIQKDFALRADWMLP